MPRQQSGGTLKIKCNGDDCRRTMDIPIPEGLIVKQLKFFCTACTKETKYKPESKDAKEMALIPADQRRLT